MHEFPAVRIQIVFLLFRPLKELVYLVRVHEIPELAELVQVAGNDDKANAVKRERRQTPQNGLPKGNYIWVIL